MPSRFFGGEIYIFTISTPYPTAQVTAAQLYSTSVHYHSDCVHIRVQCRDGENINFPPKKSGRHISYVKFYSKQLLFS